MKLVEVNGNRDPGTAKMNGHTGTKTPVGLDKEEDDEDLSDAEEEEEEPVSATLVLRVVNEPQPTSSHGTARKHSAPPATGYNSGGTHRRHHSGVDFQDTDHRDTFLQVQIQRSTSSNSVSGGDWRRNAHSRSRTSTASSPGGLVRSSSATPAVYVSEPDSYGWPIVSRSSQLSRESTRESSPCSSMYGLDITNERINPVELLRRIEQNSRAMETGLRELRDGIDTPNRLLDVGQDAIVLSGLNRQTGDSLKHIKNLYDETKYLKAYLEKLETQAHYDLVVRLAEADRPPWYRRLIFLSLLTTITIYVWHRMDPQGCTKNMTKAGEMCGSGWESVKDFFVRSSRPSTSVILE